MKGGGEVEVEEKFHCGSHEESTCVKRCLPVLWDTSGHAAVTRLATSLANCLTFDPAGFTKMLKGHRLYKIAQRNPLKHTKERRI